MAELFPFSQVPFLSQGLSRRDAMAMGLKLLGGVVSASVLNALAADDAQSMIPTRDVFPGETREIMAALTEIVIPRTDTPGALDAGVPAFVEGIVANWYSDEERSIFIDGLGEIDALCGDRHGKKFLQCSEAERVAALSEMEHKVGHHRGPASTNPFDNLMSADPNKMLTPFFSKLKELVTFGYCSSEVVSTQVFQYLPLPGHYDGHYPASKVRNNWSY
ncbi:MAG: gluconate 2-dehydrogenase subunit 3 family protein [Proteobacteria bacterium]|nr:gluconate 2-dehydrogenase subunit 3 family protein [Pseudomonadota bacterium]HQR03332.1 gluconate 2-dehydrogenase subunit 3 family protein [Rhodocyclaceae bacterium]